MLEKTIVVMLSKIHHLVCKVVIMFAKRIAIIS